MRSKTKIIASLGPSLQSQEAIIQAYELGVRIFRYNASHGEEKAFKQYLQWLKVLQKKDPMLCVFIDLPGPKLRVGELTQSLELKKDERYNLGLETSWDIPCPSFSSLVHVKKGDRILFDDGKIIAQCQDRHEHYISLNIITPGLLQSRKGINLPDTALDPSATWTEKDETWLQIGLAHGIRHFALSFVENTEQLHRLHALYPELFLIAKLERPQALRNQHHIIQASDAIMMARGDLALEFSEYEVPSAQKEAVKLARLHEKPIIIATQMLDSMNHHPKATRAEISDIANACFDLSDAVMLSNESATGSFPMEAIHTMHQTLLASEKYLFKEHSSYPLLALSPEKDYPEEVLILHKELLQAPRVFSSEDPNLSKILKHRPYQDIYVEGPSSYRYAFHWGLEALPDHELPIPKTHTHSRD